MKEYISKEELKDSIESTICMHCSNYNDGKFSKELCSICKVSQCFSCIDNMPVNSDA